MRYLNDHKLSLIACLHEGMSVKDAAKFLGCSYSTACSILRNLCLSREGKFKERKLRVTPELTSFLRYFAEHVKNIADIAKFFSITNERVSAIYKTCGVKHKWNLQDNHNDLLAASRRCELFIKNIGIPLVRDCYKTRDAGFPYDLILQGYGSVDVKHTVIQTKKEPVRTNLIVEGTTTPIASFLSEGKYASFNVQNFTKGVKYAFLVVMDEQREDFLYVFAVPGKLIFGHSTISITLAPQISNKYKEYLIWERSQ